MRRTLPDAIVDLPHKPLKAGLRGASEGLNSVEGAALIALAIARSGMSHKEAAIVMGITEAQLSRQLACLEHVSWQRLYRMPDAFWRVLLVVIAERRGVAKVTTQIELVG